MATKKIKRELSCVPCKAECCKSVTIEIDKPHSKKDFDEIRWFVLHKDVQVYIDTENKWNLEFRTPCEALDSGNRCTRYAIRPAICKLYPKHDESCVHEDNPCKRIFIKVEEVDEYHLRKLARRTARRKKKRLEKLGVAASVVADAEGEK